MKTIGYRGKRFLDLGVSLGALMLLWPLLAFVGIIVRCRLGSPIIYKQLRPGFQAKPFTLLKFRTMTDQREPDGELVPDLKRQTRCGNLLRRLSLDELPELWNVIKGDMSLVGPRPLMMAYLERYSKVQRHRHDVLPGITGLAQVNGRNNLDWQRRFEMDIHYAEHCSMWLDCRILWKTLGLVIRRDGVSAQGHFSVPEFMGNPGRPEDS